MNRPRSTAPAPGRIFIDIILPLARPGLITLAIFTFMGVYGSFYWPLIMIKSDHMRTLPIGMLFFDSNFGKQTNLLMAASVMNIIPLIVLFCGVAEVPGEGDSAWGGEGVRRRHLGGLLIADLAFGKIFSQFRCAIRCDLRTAHEKIFEICQSLKCRQ